MSSHRVHATALFLGALLASCRESVELELTLPDAPLGTSTWVVSIEPLDGSGSPSIHVLADSGAQSARATVDSEHVAINAAAFREPLASLNLQEGRVESAAAGASLPTALGWFTRSVDRGDASGWATLPTPARLISELKIPVAQADPCAAYSHEMRAIVTLSSTAGIAFLTVEGAEAIAGTLDGALFAIDGEGRSRRLTTTPTTATLLAANGMPALVADASGRIWSADYETTSDVVRLTEVGRVPDGEPIVSVGGTSRFDVLAALTRSGAVWFFQSGAGWLRIHEFSRVEPDSARVRRGRMILRGFANYEVYAAMPPAPYIAHHRRGELTEIALGTAPIEALRSLNTGLVAADRDGRVYLAGEAGWRTYDGSSGVPGTIHDFAEFTDGLWMGGVDGRATMYFERSGFCASEQWAPATIREMDVVPAGGTIFLAGDATLDGLPVTILAPAR